MQPDPIRVIAYSSLILGSFFLAKSISGKTPKYVLQELLSFKVNKSRFFRKYISQRLEAVIGFMFLFLGFAIQLYLEVQALGEEGRRSGSGFDNWWLVIGITVVAMLGIAFVLSRVTRFFSNKVFVEHVRFMVVTHGFPPASGSGPLPQLRGGGMGYVPKRPVYRAREQTDPRIHVGTLANRTRIRHKAGSQPGPPRRAPGANHGHRKSPRTSGDRWPAILLGTAHHTDDGRGSDRSAGGSRGEIARPRRPCP